MISKTDDLALLALQLQLAATPHLDQMIREELARIVDSAAFRSSRRSQLLLRYVVENTLESRFDHLKERILGAELFGRSANYATGQDSVVRVAASDLRKRLREFYETATPGPVQIQLPVGQYLPEFVVGVPPEPATEPAAAPSGGQPDSRRLMPLIAGALLCAMIGAGVSWIFATRLLPRRNPDANATRLLPWSVVFRPGHRSTIIVADASLALFLQYFDSTVPMSKYTDQLYLKEAGEAPIAKLLMRPPLTTLAVATVAARIAALGEAAGQTTVVRGSQRVRIADLKGEDGLILLGSAMTNPWVRLLDQTLDFQIQFDPAVKTGVCRVKNPQAGERAVYIPEVSAGSEQSYAVVSLVPNLSGTAWALIIAGTNMEGTEAAGELVTDLPRLAETLRRIGVSPGQPLRRLELLLRLNYLQAASTRSEVIAHRIVGNK